MNTLDASLKECRPSFGRHETFHPRFAWLTRGVGAVAHDPLVFSRDDAPATLGVGKNMVHAIRYWCLAFGLIEERAPVEKKSRQRGHALTKLAINIFGKTGDNGPDPYLEHPASLWLLHSHLMRRGGLAPTWTAALHLVPQAEFSSDDLFVAAKTYAEFLAGDDAPSATILRRDVSCFLRMYGIHDGVSRGEDPMESPFADLRLIRRRSDDTLAWDENLKLGLAPELVAARAVDHMASDGSKAATITIGRLLTDPWSPGVVFRLREAQLIEFLQRAEEKHPSLHVVETSALTQLSVKGDPLRVVEELEWAALGQLARRSTHGARH